MADNSFSLFLHCKSQTFREQAMSAWWSMTPEVTLPFRGTRALQSPQIGPMKFVIWKSPNHRQVKFFSPWTPNQVLFGNLNFSQGDFCSSSLVEPRTLSDAQNRNRDPVSTCETHNSTPNLEWSLGPKNMYDLPKRTGLTPGAVTIETFQSSAQFPLIYVLQISCLHILIIDYFNYILKKNISPTKKMSTRYSQVISPVQSPLSR